MMSDRDVWVKAGEIVAEHGDLTADYIIGQLGNVLGNCIAVEDWRRIAAAVDIISEATPQ
jgi:predicted NACHT family NTPase